MNWLRSTERLIRIVKRGIGNTSRGAFLWVGAGLSIPAGYPSWGQLAEMLRKESLENLDEDLESMQTIDAFVEANGAAYLSQNLADIFTQKQPMEYHKDLVNLPWRGIITTNYDELLEDALKQVKRPYLKITLNRNIDLTAHSDMPLYKIHGDIAEFESIVLTGKSYETFSQRYSLLQSDLESLLRKHSIVFFGCGMTDPRLLDWLRRLGTSKRAMLMPSCAVITKVDWDRIPEEDRELLTEGQIRPILLNNHAEIPELISYLVKEIPPEPSGAGLYFSVYPTEKNQWRIMPNVGAERLVEVPWEKDRTFGGALIEFIWMADRPVGNDGMRRDLNSCAMKLGEALSAALLTDEDRQNIRNAIGQDGPPPMVTIESDDEMVLSLPWELLRIDGEFAIRESRIDLVRSAISPSEAPPTLPRPDRCMKLVVNVSAPEGESIGHMDYEAESYRLIRALHDYSAVVFTELGTVDDMLSAIAKHEPIGVHFSGHGAPGKLLFEDDEGMENPVGISDVLRMIREKSPEMFPRFFYLASCHGNTPANPEEGKAGSIISAAELHREGVVQVIGYYGPIVDELSTMAEVAIYSEIAAGRSTRHGIRQARAALAKGPDVLGKGIHRGRLREKVVAFPFAWAQLVFYHRGPDHPLSLKLQEKYPQQQEARLQRLFEGSDHRRILSTGFIGRRRELHRFYKAHRRGQRVFVFQGLGGLGKSTLSFRVLSLLAQGTPVLTIWCHELEDEENQAQELAGRLSKFGQKLLGSWWAEVVTDIDRMPNIREPQRFELFLQHILQHTNHVFIYLDNMESLLKGPVDENPQAFGNWRSREVEGVWDTLKQMSGDRMTVVASCRYRNTSFIRDIIHVSEMTDDAIFRMMGWFDGIRRLSVASRERLVDLLHGHPRAVEFLDDLVKEAMGRWEDRYGQWITPTTKNDNDIEREWAKLIAPALPAVEEQLRQNLLLNAIWGRILNNRCKKMLFRMTLLRRPWNWDLMMQLGEPEEDGRITEVTSDRLRGSSLLEQVMERSNERWEQLFQLHPMTASFIVSQFDSERAEELRQETYQRVGTYLEKLAETSSDIRVGLDAGHYLLGCGEVDRAFILLDYTSQTLRERGMVRDSIAVLRSFEQVEIMKQMAPELTCRMLSDLGLAYQRLMQTERAIEYYQHVLPIAREMDDKREEINGLASLGLAYNDLGDMKRAIEYHQQALAIARKTKDLMAEASILGNLGLAYADLGNMEEAVNYYQQELAIAGKIKDVIAEGSILGKLGNAYCHLHDMKKATEYHKEALTIARKIDNRRLEGQALGSLGNVYATLSEEEKAIDYYQQALVIARETEDPMAEGSILGNLGNVYADCGKMEKAIGYYQQALALAREIGDPTVEGSILGGLGNVYAALGRVKRARDYLELALAIAREIKNTRVEAFVLEVLKSLNCD